MKTLPAGEFKAQFSKVLEKVKHGESFGILYGRMNVPYVESGCEKERKIGVVR